MNYEQSINAPMEPASSAEHPENQLIRLRESFRKDRERNAFVFAAEAVLRARLIAVGATDYEIDCIDYLNKKAAAEIDPLPELTK